MYTTRTKTLDRKTDSPTQLRLNFKVTATCRDQTKNPSVKRLLLDTVDELPFKTINHQGYKSWEKSDKITYKSINVKKKHVCG